MVSPSALCDLGQRTDPPAMSPYVTVFVCANCARSSDTPEAVSRRRPDVPDFAWPFPAQEVLVSCTGRLQPEHVLKAFESGARLVCAIACAEDNCHYLEGSKRCARRVDYLRGILDEVGLGGDRLLLLHMAGTAAEDMAVAAGGPALKLSAETVGAQAAAIREAVVQVLGTLTPTPLDIALTEAAEDPYQRVDANYDDNED